MLEKRIDERSECCSNCQNIGKLKLMSLSLPVKNICTIATMKAARKHLQQLQL